MIALTIALTIAEPVLLSRKRLTPKFYTISSLTKSMIWIALVTAAAVLNQEKGQYNSSGASIVITIVLIGLFVVPVIYGGAIWIRTRRSEEGCAVP